MRLRPGGLMVLFMKIVKCQRGSKPLTGICTRRFPLQQPTKIRLIDDGLESGLNSAYSCYNKLTLMDMDAVVALANLVLQAFASKGCFRHCSFLRANV